jgi:hypothetical protein
MIFHLFFNDVFHKSSPADDGGPHAFGKVRIHILTIPPALFLNQFKPSSSENMYGLGSI